ncbi:hypothetical protein D3C71_1888560 [compost metagenome]
MGKSYEVRVYGEQHQLDRHQQNNQVLAIEENTNDGEGEKHGPQREEVTQSQRHAFFSSTTG